MSTDERAALTPGGLRAAELPRAFFGYGVEPTRRLLDEAAEALDFAVTKFDRLGRDIRRLEEELAATVRREGGSGKDERLISEALISATRAAEELREKARREGEGAVADAKTRASEIVAAAERESEAVRVEARKQVEAVLDEAKAEAQRIVAAAPEQVEAVLDEAKAEAQQIVAGATT